VLRAPGTGGPGLFLNQERVFPAKYNEGAWVLDTGATNHDMLPSFVGRPG